MKINNFLKCIIIILLSLFVTFILFLFCPKIYKIYERFNSPFKYNDILNSELNVLKILSDKCFIVLHEGEIKEYFSDKNLFGKTLFSLKDYSITEEDIALSDTGILFKFQDDTYNYLKYQNFINGQILDIVLTNKNNLINMYIEDDKIVYYLKDNNTVEVNFFNLKTNKNKLILELESTINNKESNYLSQPNITDEYIIFSTIREGEDDKKTSKIYFFNSENDEINLLNNKDDLIYKPILYKNKLLGLKENIVNEIIPDELNDLNSVEYYANCIVVFNEESNSWINLFNNYDIIKKDENVFDINQKEGFLYWISSFTNKGYFYDLKNNKVESLFTKKINKLRPGDYNFSILDIQDNIILYKVDILGENNSLKQYIYKFK